LEENFLPLLNNAKEKALKEKDYELLIKLTAEEMRRAIRSKEEVRKAYEKNCLENGDYTRLINSAINKIQNDKKTADKIALKAYQAIEGAPMTEKERKAYIEACRKYEAELLKGKKPTCSSTSGAKVTELGGYLPYVVEIIDPDTGKKKKIWFNANAQHDYFEYSPYWEKIPRLTDGTLDHKAANGYANGGIVEFSYKNPEGKEGHTATVMYSENLYSDKKGWNTEVTYIYSYNASKEKVETTSLDVQVSKGKEGTSEYYRYIGPIIK
jgi:hypothetical protein